MNGAEALIRTAIDCGVEVCFANPGTSEIDMVAAVDKLPKLRTVLGLFEGVCTGAADGYARMKDKPAMTLLHLGPGLGNGLANLHNARRAHSPVVNIIGEHATYHIKHDAPLNSDIESIAKGVSGWIRRSKTAADVPRDVAEAIAASQAPPGQICTLMIPMDCSNEKAEGAAKPVAIASAGAVEDKAIQDAAERLKKGGKKAAILLGAAACREDGLRVAGRIAAATGCRLFGEPFIARLDRGAGRVPIERLPYFPEDVLRALGEVETLLLVGSKQPVSFFAYPDYPSVLVPESCESVRVAELGQDIVGALEAIADGVGAAANGYKVTEEKRPDKPTGKLDTRTVGAAIGALMPENAILIDEAATSGGPTYFLTQNGPAHTSLYLTGGAIGFGLPSATGAAIACPDRKVLALQADGSGMYTVQALWTHARESLDITTVVFSNRKYQILQVELARAGVSERGPKAEALTDLSHPQIEWAALSKSLGVPATTPKTADDFCKDLENALAEPGPHLIEVLC